MPTFADDISEIAADYRKRRARLVGDGMAVVAPRFMDFSGERVAPAPPREEPFDWAAVSVAHRHRLGDECLTPVDEAPLETKTSTVMVKQTGWYACTAASGGVPRHPHTIHVHDHDGSLVGHPLRDPRCPVPLP